MKPQKFVGYGELLLRLTPFEQGSLIEQSDNLKMGFAGAEANIIADLALMGHATDFVTAFPQNPLGRSAAYFLQRLGVNTQRVVWDNGRLGTYYIEHGTSIRSTRVTYDRANSSVTQTVIPQKAWEDIFSEASHFILTGVTPALSQICRDNIQTALTVAKTQGVKIVFDLNYRRTLWTVAEARPSFECILPFVDILVANTGSAFDVFDIKTSAVHDFASLETATKEAADALGKLGNFECVAMTIRYQLSANQNILGGLIQKDGKDYFSRPLPTEIVDRLGGGDAFAAAMLHGFVKNWEPETIVNFGTAAFAGTQTIQGDINFLTEDELQSIASGNIQGFVKR